MISSSRDRPQVDTVVVFWILALFVITALGALPLFFYRLDLSKLTFSTPIPVAVGIGIEITADAPTLAALLVVAVVPGGGGLGGWSGRSSDGGLAFPGISLHYSARPCFSSSAMSSASGLVWRFRHIGWSSRGRRRLRSWWER
jgi:hypothetical protein